MVLHGDKDAGFVILGYIDLAYSFTEAMFQNYINTIVSKYPILKQYFAEENGALYLKDSVFNIVDHVDIVKDTLDNFDSYVASILNRPFKTKSRWSITYLTDTFAKKRRLYFKIDHAYADGYKIIEMLTSPFEMENPLKQLKHKEGMFNLYYLVFGTIYLVILNMSLLFKFLFQPSTTLVETKRPQTKSIICKAFDLTKIKEFTKRSRITVNDFMYALMVKTDYLYRKVRRRITTVSSINVSDGKDLNNMTPIFMNIQNSLTNSELLDNVHEIFNSYKYSLFIPGLTYTIQTAAKVLTLNALNSLYSSIIAGSDYIFSNIIGPSHSMIEDIHFLTIAKGNEIVFNIISSNDKINVICSFRDGVISDIRRFESCIYQAYMSLVNTI